MKLIIDIPEWKYKSICEGVEASKRCGVVGIDPDIHEAIYNGKPYEERPQGEWVRKEDIIHLLERWSDGYSYIEIPTEDAIKKIKEMGGGAEND